MNWKAINEYDWRGSAGDVECRIYITEATEFEGSVWLWKDDRRAVRVRVMEFTAKTIEEAKAELVEAADKLVMELHSALEAE